MPSEDRPPSIKLDVPDILPLKHSDSVPNREAMLNESPLVHPDSNSLRKYCLGTGLQMRQNSKSHKLPTCAYHNPHNSIQGKFIKTMNQEALQVKYILAYRDRYH